MNNRFNRFWAIQNVPAANNKTVVAHQDGVTDDIISQIEKDFLKSWQQTEFIALQFKGANLHETCQNIHSWIRKYIKYQLDKKGQQDIKTPSKIITDGFGDCKAYSILTGSILANLGIHFRFRFVRFKPSGDVTHVYCVVDNNRKEIVIDACLPLFGNEKPYREKKDIDTMTKINSISGIGRTHKKCGCDSVGDAEVGFLRKLKGKVKNAIKKVSNLALNFVPGGEIIQNIKENKKNGKKWFKGLAKSVAKSSMSFVPGGKGVSLGLKAGKAVKLALKAKKALKAAKALKNTAKASKALKAIQKGKNIVAKSKKYLENIKNTYDQAQDYIPEEIKDQARDVFNQADELNIPHDEVKDLILDKMESQYREEEQERQEQEQEDSNQQQYNEEEEETY